MQELIIYGSSGHAGVIIDAVEKEGKFCIKGLIDDYREKGDCTLGYNVLGGYDCLKGLLEAGIRNIFIAVGDNNARKKLAEQVLNMGFKFVSIIHPFSSIGKNACIEEGAVILQGAVLDPSVHVGKGVIVGDRVAVGHDSKLGDFSHLAGGVFFGANSDLGECSFIGIGAIVISNTHIGSNVYIGAGSLVTKDIIDDVKAVGSPARIIKNG